MSRDETLPSRGSKLMRLYLLAAALIVTPIALSYGIDPANTLPRFLTIAVEGTDQTQIFRAMMCLYLGAVVFWTVAAFKPDWQRPAVVWAVIFSLSLALGRIISLIVDGPASRLLDIYLAVELAAGFFGLAILAYERRKSRP
jgi:Domain of unknown function (DUF4345)